MSATWPRDAPSGAPLSVEPPPPSTQPGEVEPHSAGGEAGEAYELGGLLGRGGMGEVRVAHDPRLGRDVALKRPRPGDLRAAARLAREAALTASLEHPNIVTVYAAGRDPDGQPYYTMRVLPGRSLADAIAAAVDTPARLRLVRHVLGAAEAMAYAHGRGILHRDLKPGNIMVGAFGETVVADWGLACTLDEQASAPGGGTPGYMSPEQVRGEILDARADVYGLGAVLHEILTGAPPPPWDGRSGTVTTTPAAPPLKGPADGPPLSPAAGPRPTVPSAPAELAAIAEHALRRDPNQRYPSARALADDLLAWFEGRRVGAYDYTLGQLARRLLAAWRVPLTVGALGLAALVVAVGVGWSRTAAETDRALASEARAVTAREGEQAALARVLLAQALTAADQDRAMEAEILAANALVRQETPAARGVLARFYDRPRMGIVARSPLLPPCRARALSPAGTRLLCAESSTATLRDPLSPDTPLATTPGRFQAAAFAGDETHIVLVHADGTLSVWAPPAAPIALSSAYVASPQFGPSAVPGQVPVVVSATTSIIDAVHARIQRVRGCVGAVDVAVALAADGTLYFGCDDRSIRYGAPGGEITQWTRLGERDVIESLALPVSGRAGEGLFVGTLRGAVLHLDAAGVVQARLNVGAETILAVMVGPDRVAAASNDGAVRVWTTDTGLPLGKLHVPGALLAWRDDGAELRIVGARTEDRRVPVPARPHQHPLSAGVGGLGTSPDGARVAVALGDGTIQERVLATGLVEATWRWGTGVAKDVAYRADGARLATAQATGEDQRVYTRPGGILAGALQGVNLRRVGWTRGDWLLAAAYTPGLWGWREERAAPVRLLEAQIQELEVDASGTNIAAVDTMNGVWLGHDGDPPTFVQVTTLPQAHAVAPLTDGVLVTVRNELFRLDARGVEVGRWTLPADVTDIAVSADERLLAIGHADGDVTVWDLRTRATLALLSGHSARIGALSFTSDGRWLVTGGWDDAVRVWSLGALDLPAEALRADLEGEWGRNLEEVLTEGG